jgi:ABC-type hemin transport system ATPase subunit
MKTNLKPIIHRKDGTISYWSVYEQMRMRCAIARMPDREIAALSGREQARVHKAVTAARQDAEVL